MDGLTKACPISKTRQHKTRFSPLTLTIPSYQKWPQSKQTRLLLSYRKNWNPRQDLTSSRITYFHYWINNRSSKVWKPWARRIKIWNSLRSTNVASFRHLAPRLSKTFQRTRTDQAVLPLSYNQKTVWRKKKQTQTNFSKWLRRNKTLFPPMKSNPGFKRENLSLPSPKVNTLARSKKSRCTIWVRNVRQQHQPISWSYTNIWHGLCALQMILKPPV